MWQGLTIAMIAPVALAAQSPASKSGVVPVASGGKAQAAIVLGEAAGEGAKYAASELQKTSTLSLALRSGSSPTDLLPRNLRSSLGF
jgi:hypothetical protein